MTIQIKRSVYETAAENERLSPEELSYRQTEPLGELLCTALENVDAYRPLRHLLPLARKEPFEALERFPVLYGEHLRKNPISYLRQGLDPSGLYQCRLPLPGGETVRLYLDKPGRNCHRAAAERALRWRNMKTSGRHAEITENGIKLGGGGVSGIAASLFAPGGDWERLYSFRPRYIRAETAALRRFLKNPAPQGTTGAELLIAAGLPKDTAALKDAFGCEVIFDVGAGFGSLSLAVCTGGGYHMPADMAVYEILDPLSGQPVKDGAMGALCVTELYNHAMPLVRRYLAPASTAGCACGLGLPCVSFAQNSQATGL